MEYRNELLDELVGKPVIVALLKAPDVDEEAAEKMRSNPMFGRTELVQSLRTSYELVAYDAVGVTLRTLAPEYDPFLVP